MNNRVLENIRSIVATAGKVVVHAIGSATIKPFKSRSPATNDLLTPTAERILYVNLAYRGDLILSFPAISALKQRFPGSRITCWVRGYNVDLARLCPDVDEIISYDSFSPQGLALFVEILRSHKHREFLAAVSDRRFDLMIDESGAGFSAWAGAKAGIRLRIGRNTQGFGFWYHFEFPYDQDTNILDSKLRILEPLGIYPVLGARQLPRLRIDPELVNSALAKVGISADGPGYFTIQPYGGWAAKNWPEAKVALVASGFGRTSGLLPILLGGEADRHKIASLCSQLECESINAAGLLSLSEAAALVSGAALHLGVDSVVAHMAAALSVKSLTLFGPTNPELSAALSTTNAATLKRVWCSPPAHKRYCFLDAGRACPRYRCMEELEAEHVLAVLTRLWRGSLDLNVTEF